MILKQISVFVENRSGRLSEITEVLAGSQVDIRALSIADTTNFGILRLIVNRPETAYQALKAAGCTVSITEVIAIVIEDRPGTLSAALTALAADGVNVEYMYAFTSRESGTANVILRVDNNEKALSVLAEKGIKTLSSEDIYEE